MDLPSLAAQAQPGPTLWVALALMTGGLMAKAALFPMHFWLPPAHANAPAPVSALLSALVVKGSFYILLRLWFEAFPALLTPAVAQCLTRLGGFEGVRVVSGCKSTRRSHKSALQEINWRG